jgi:hypothetical protein
VVSVCSDAAKDIAGAAREHGGPALMGQMVGESGAEYALCAAEE